MLFDTHAHINFKAYSEDGDEVIKRALDNNVWMINIGSQYSTSKRAVEYAEKYPLGIYAAVGLHPLHLEEIKIALPQEGEFKSRKEMFDIKQYRELALAHKTVAIGEIGLDYYHIEENTFKLNIELASGQRIQDSKELISNIINYQKQIFLEQLKLAAEINKPVIVHCRSANQDTFDIIKHTKEKHTNLRGVIHCFNDSLEQAKKYINLGFCIGFNGLITFAREWDEVIRKIDLDKILLETDCPYLTPMPFRGKRNEPVYVQYVAKKIAEIKKLSLQEVEKQTFANAKKLFNI